MICLFIKIQVVNWRKKNRLKLKEKKNRLYFALLESFKASLYGKFYEAVMVQSESS